MRFALMIFAAWAGAAVARAQMFILPTPNRALIADGALSEKYLVGTTGKPWQSGGYGCVRSEGFKMHEGLDIRCTQRDKRGEPIDPVVASAAGTVAYINNKPGLSNYGRYIVIRHNIEGLEICTLYAHLSEIQDGLAIGQTVKQGQRNDHGDWNGFNLAAIDPAPLLLAAAREGTNFSLLKHVQARKEVCRVLVRDTKFSFLRHYPALIKQKPEIKDVRSYAIALDFNGAPIELIPYGEPKSPTKVQLLNVNEAELAEHPCSHLIVTRKGRRQLGNAGEQRVSLLTY